MAGTILEGLLANKTLVLDIGKINIVDLASIQEIVANAPMMPDTGKLFIRSATEGSLEWKTAYTNFPGGVFNKHDVTINVEEVTEQVELAYLYMADDLTTIRLSLKPTPLLTPLFESMGSMPNWLKLRVAETNSVELMYFWSERGDYYVSTTVSLEELDPSLQALTLKHHEFMTELDSVSGLPIKVYTIGESQ